jgi:hypothetical protein
MTLEQMVVLAQLFLDDVAGVAWTVQEIVEALDTELRSVVRESYVKRDDRALRPYIRSARVQHGDRISNVEAPVALRVITGEDPARWINAHYVPWHLWTTYTATLLPYPRTCRWTLERAPTTAAPGDPGQGLDYFVWWDLVRPEWNEAEVHYVETPERLLGQLPNWSSYEPLLPSEYLLTVIYRAVKRLITEYQRTEAERYVLPEWAEPKQSSEGKS